MVRASGIHYWRGVIRRASDRSGIWEAESYAQAMQRALRLMDS